jgi:hypothetical protein
LLFVRIMIGGRSNLPENAAGNSKNSHAFLLFSGGLDVNVVARTIARPEANPKD